MTLHLVHSASSLPSLHADLLGQLNPRFTSADIRRLDSLFERFGLRVRSHDNAQAVFNAWQLIVERYGPALRALILCPAEAGSALRELPVGHVEYVEAVLKGDRALAKHFAGLLGIEELAQLT